MMQFTVNDIVTFAESIPGAQGLAVANDGRVFVGAQDGWVYFITVSPTVGTSDLRLVRG